MTTSKKRERVKRVVLGEGILLKGNNFPFIGLYGLNAIPCESYLNKEDAKLVILKDGTGTFKGKKIRLIAEILP